MASVGIKLEYLLNFLVACRVRGESWGNNVREEGLGRGAIVERSCLLLPLFGHCLRLANVADNSENHFKMSQVLIILGTVICKTPGFAPSPSSENKIKGNYITPTNGHFKVMLFKIYFLCRIPLCLEELSRRKSESY